MRFRFSFCFVLRTRNCKQKHFVFAVSISCRQKRTACVVDCHADFIGSQ
ncbi:hypothetical protein [Campylobacter troglodytis]|nr:hypothetical protein [Campylobacter troglodytis]